MLSSSACALDPFSEAEQASRHPYIQKQRTRTELDRLGDTTIEQFAKAKWDEVIEESKDVAMTRGEECAKHFVDA